MLKLPIHIPEEAADDIRMINPVEGCTVEVQYVGTMAKNAEIFDTTRDMYKGVCIGGTDDPKSFMLLREKVVQGFDLAVATMVVGEISSFVVRAGKLRRGQGVKPRAGGFLMIGNMPQPSDPSFRPPSPPPLLDYGYSSALPESLPKVGVGDTLIYEIELVKVRLDEKRSDELLLTLSKAAKTPRAYTSVQDVPPP